MRKKAYRRLFGITALLIAGFLALPWAIGSTAAPVTLIRPSIQKFSEDIYVSGTVEETARSELTVDLPLVPKNVFVELGDRVETNQLLAEVDQKATQEALMQLVGAVDLIPSEYRTLLAGMDLDLSLLSSVIPSELRAPASGTVTSLSLVPGGAALPSSSVCTVSQTDQLRLKMLVGETEADQVEEGDLVVFQADATGTEKYTGEVSSVFPAASKTLVGTSQQTVVGTYVTIHRQDTRLKPGYTVTGVIKKKAAKEAMVLPYTAVSQDEENQEFVYVYENGRAIKRVISTGMEYSDGVTVLDGLSSEDLVIEFAEQVPRENCLLRAG